MATPVASSAARRAARKTVIIQVFGACVGTSTTLASVNGVVSIVIAGQGPSSSTGGTGVSCTTHVSGKVKFTDLSNPTFIDGILPGFNDVGDTPVTNGVFALPVVTGGFK